jgi:glyoxylase I family protein
VPMILGIPYCRLQPRWFYPGPSIGGAGLGRATQSRPEAPRARSRDGSCRPIPGGTPAGVRGSPLKAFSFGRSPFSDRLQGRGGFCPEHLPSQGDRPRLKESAIPRNRGLDHVTFTVTDLDRSVAWYRRLFDARNVSATREGPTGTELLTLEDGFVIGLKVHARTERKDRFDPTRVGLDHIAWWADSRDELESWQRRAEELGAENSGIVAAPDGLYLNVKDPDGTALEFYVPTSGSA